MARLTPIQRKIVEEILRFKVQHSFAPTVRELAAAAHLSPSTTHHHLDSLERLGVITRVANRPRTIAAVEETNADPLDDPPAPDVADDLPEG